MVGVQIGRAQAGRDINIGVTEPPTWFAATQYWIKASPSFRTELIGKLLQTRWGGLYQSNLEGAVTWFDTFFGSKLSMRAFATCLVIAIVYAYLGYWLAYSLGAPGSLATTELLAPRRNPIAQAFIGLGLGLVAACLGAWWTGYLGGRLERWRRRRWLTERRQHALGGYALRGALMALVTAIGAALILYHSTAFDRNGSVFLLNAGYLFSSAIILPMFFFMRRERRVPVAMALPSGAIMLVSLMIVSFVVVRVIFPSEKIVDNLIPITVISGGLSLAVAGAFVGLGAAAVAVALIVAWNLGALGVVLGAVNFLPNAGIGGLANGAATSAAAALGVAQGLWRKRGRLAWMTAIGALWIVPLILLYLPARDQGGDGPRPIILLFFAFFIVIPLFNASFDWISWLWTRWLAEHLRNSLRSADRTGGSAVTILWHTLGDLILGVISLALLVWFLAFAFELYGQAGWAGPMEAQHGFAEGSHSYMLPMIDKAMTGPWQNSFWIWLMLISTLVPTMIHFVFLVFTPLAVVALPDRRRRDLITRLKGFKAASPEEQTTTIRKAVTYFAYERRIIWIAAAACVVFGPIGIMAGIVYLTGWQPLGYVADGLYAAALSWINWARWLMGVGP